VFALGNKSSQTFRRTAESVHDEILEKMADDLEKHFPGHEYRLVPLGPGTYITSFGKKDRMVSDELVIKLSRAIAKAEGFYEPNSIPAKIHNPGDVTDGGEGACGVFHSAGPHGAPLTIFATDEDGWRALYKKVRRMLDGASRTYSLELTIMEVAIKWAGSAAWAENVAREMGVDTRTTMASLASADYQAQKNGEQSV
jgi:hypothetical protein